MLATASCSTMEASKRDRGNDGDGLSFEVDEDLEELLVDGEGRRWTACCLFARISRAVDASFVSDG